MQDVHKKRGLGGRGWLIEEMLNIKNCYNEWTHINEARHLIEKYNTWKKKKNYLSHQCNHFIFAWEFFYYKNRKTQKYTEAPCPSFKVSWKSYQRIFFGMLLYFRNFHFNLFYLCTHINLFINPRSCWLPL